MGKAIAEKLREWRKRKGNWEKDAIRKTKKREQMSDKELDQLRLRNKLNKQKSRSNMSHQKKNAQKVKDRKHKSEVIVKESPKDYSTPRVQKYGQRKKESQLKVKTPFLRRSPKRLTSSERTNVNRATKFINTKAKSKNIITDC